MAPYSEAAAPLSISETQIEHGADEESVQLVHTRICEAAQAFGQRLLARTPATWPEREAGSNLMITGEAIEGVQWRYPGAGGWR
jgi:hypothetical protein